MKLPMPFLRLPLQFDAPALATEIARFDESEWRPHPQGLPGNSAVPLVAVDGNPESDAVRGPMAPTPHLDRCPYLKQVIASLGVVVGRTRLMRLSGQAEVSLHVDTAYYWWQRVRVHVPIVTQPTVRFICGDAEVNMRAGECWIFDTWRMHRVLNDAEQSRVHLVVDTVGGEGFSALVARGLPYRAADAAWSPTPVAPRPDAAPALRYESQNVPTVMTPWELREYLYFLFSEALPHPRLSALRSAGMQLEHAWQSLWACHGDKADGWPEFRAALNRFVAQLREAGPELQMRNGTQVFTAMTGLTQAALADHGAVEVDAHPQAAAAAVRPRTDARFERPVFIVSSPRSGSTLLFETLAKAPGVYTIGDESHALIEGIPDLRPGMRQFSSNRLTAVDATTEIAETLRARMERELRDRSGAAPPADQRIRVLEKTPKNSLRVPFLAQVFPEAHFIYLHRDVRQTLSSMIEAWQSGRFRTYPRLPAWTGLPWSMLLVPGWRDLIGRPLPEIVAKQWETTTRVLLDDLEALPRERWTAVRYDDFVADPQAEIARLCTAVGYDWDQALDSELPAARYTVTAPAKDKWRRHESQIAAILPGLDETIARADRFATRA
jgi:LPS sulfotransferase NodH